MAKLSVVHRGLKRQKTVKQFQKKRNELKEQLALAYGAEEGAWEVLQKIQAFPRNASVVRLERRCQVCGRPRGVYRKFGLCRLCLRKYAMQGLVPGLHKASW